MQANFWNSLPRPYFILAPMEDVTDVVFRHVVAQAARPDVFFTEFTNTDSYVHSEGKESLRGRLTFTPDEQPLVAHIWGDKPEAFAAMSEGLAARGFSGIDINMGCPAPNVYRHGKGAGLIKRPETAAAIIQAAKTGGLPVSVKTRLGVSSPAEYKDWLSLLLEQDIVNLTIHLRTKKEMSKVPAHWDLIPEIKRLRDEIAPQTLLTINGDIENYQMGLDLYHKYDIDGIMIGRGVFHDPFAFEKVSTTHSNKEYIDLLKFHWDTYDKFSSQEPQLSKILNRFYKIYIKDFPGASDLRTALMNTKNTKDARIVLADFEAKHPEMYALDN